MVGVMSEEEIERVLANVAGTLAVEGLETSQKCKQISTEYLRNKLTSKEVINKIKQLYNCKIIEN